MMLPLVTHGIVTKVPRLSSQYNGYVVLMVVFVSIGFGIMADVTSVDVKHMEFYEFYVKLVVYAGVLIGWGLFYRNSVIASFKKTYYTTMAGYTYVIFTTGVLMHWVSLFIHIS